MSEPPNPADPVLMRVRVRYGKTGRLRFASHRDFARALERALRRAESPIAYSGGFTPHPRISYLGAAPTGVASEAEYLELGMAAAVDPEDLLDRLGDALPHGFDIHEVVVVPPGTSGSLADRIDASMWRIEVDTARAEPTADDLTSACATFLGAVDVTTERLTKDGRRTVDVRSPVVSLTMGGPGHSGAASVILEAVVRHVTPAVRPDDLVAGLSAVAGIRFGSPVRATRMRQGRLGEDGGIEDPLAAHRR